MSTHQWDSIKVPVGRDGRIDLHYPTDDRRLAISHLHSIARMLNNLEDNELPDPIKMTKETENE